ncbi:Cupin 2 conserved barrel domain protein [Dehalogenimonas lykanthroporepellens BL-DC-9]|nr:Cupin 2 conserved barrel domain protein [Dehalogenimonas lykanthroporepellens BL-DC-9]
MTDKEDIIAQALVMGDLINYQPGAVVSRTLTDKPAGTITLFAFDAGQGLSEHSAPYDAFVYAVDGEADVTISGKSNMVKKGQMIIMPANEPHALRAVAPFKMLLVMIRSKAGA